MTLHIMETVRITPATDFNSLSIPLTVFDLLWLYFQPVKRVIFYKLTDTTHDHFHSIILPKLKLSLSLVLPNYLPLIGRITWNPNDLKPRIVISQNDAVLVTIAETDADFSHLSGYGKRAVSELHALLPKLPVSEHSATAFSIQITLFPNQGFSIGVVTHHSVLDGKTLSNFFKAWAHLCKQQQLDNVVPESLSPSYDRSLIKDLTGHDEKMIQVLRSVKEDKTNLTSLTPFPLRELGDDVFLATLVLSRNDIERLKERVNKESKKSLHLSTFVISYAYASTCLLKARGGDKERSVSLLFVADFRERLDPKLPVNYFGNCIFPVGCYNRKAVEFTEEKGFVKAVENLSDLVKGLSSRNVETFVDNVAECFYFERLSKQFVSVAGSTRLGIYGWDFGWGRPVKADVVSIDQSEGISMAETRDEPGGVEIGMCLKESEIDMVLSLFYNGLQI